MLPKYSPPELLTPIAHMRRSTISGDVHSATPHTTDQARPAAYKFNPFTSNSSLTTGESATEWARNRTRSLQWTPAANSSAVGVPRSTGSSRYALSFADELPSENPCTVFPSSEVGYESEGSVSPMSEGYSERELSDCSVSSMSTSSDKSDDSIASTFSYTYQGRKEKVPVPPPTNPVESDSGRKRPFLSPRKLSLVERPPYVPKENPTIEDLGSTAFNFDPQYRIVARLPASDVVDSQFSGFDPNAEVESYDRATVAPCDISTTPLDRPTLDIETVHEDTEPSGTPVPDESISGLEADQNDLVPKPKRHRVKRPTGPILSRGKNVNPVDPPVPLDAKYLTCQFTGCGQTMPNERLIVRSHINKVHAPGGTTNKDILVCRWMNSREEECGTPSRSNGMFRHVLDRHTSLILVVCNFCFESFRKDSLNRHQRGCHAKPHFG